MVLLNQENRLVTGSADSELRAWDIEYIEEVIRFYIFTVLIWAQIKCTLNLCSMSVCILNMNSVLK